MMDLAEVAKRALELRVEDQHKLAQLLARNCGYKLVPEDSIQDAEDQADVIARLERLEAAVLELNPGLNWP